MMSVGNIQIFRSKNRKNDILNRKNEQEKRKNYEKIDNFRKDYGESGKKNFQKSSHSTLKDRLLNRFKVLLYYEIKMGLTVSALLYCMIGCSRDTAPFQNSEQKSKETVTTVVENPHTFPPTWIDDAFERLQASDEREKAHNAKCYMKSRPLIEAPRNGLPTLEECVSQELECLSFFYRQGGNNFERSFITPQKEAYKFMINENVIRLNYSITWYDEGLRHVLNYMISCEGGQSSQVEAIVFNSDELGSRNIMRKFFTNYNESLTCRVGFNIKEQDTTLQSEIQKIFYNGILHLANNLSLEGTNIDDVFRQKIMPEEYLKGLDTFAGKVIRTIDEHGESLGGNNRKGINFDNEGFHYKIELENQFRGYKAQLRLNEDLLKGCELTVKETGLECIDGLQQEVTNYVSIQLSTNKVQFAILTNPIEFYMPDRSEVEELNTVAIQQELTVRLTDNQSAEIRSIVVVQKALGLLLRKYEVSSNK